MTDKEKIEYLWNLLDEVAFASDLHRMDLPGYRRAVEHLAQRRLEVGKMTMTPEGYRFRFEESQ